MNQEIAISVKNKIAETTFSEVVSFNSVYRLKFAFDEEWNNYPSRVAVVMWAGGAAEKLFTGTECEMPQITSLDADSVLIGVYSRLGTERIASSFVRLRCEAGAGGFPRPKPSASLHEQVLSFLNEKDWEIFADKVAEGIYSAVRVNKKGLVTEGMKIIEVSKDQAGQPSEELAPGGIFFRLQDGVYVPHYFDGEKLEELKLSASGGSLGHTLKIGDQSYDGTQDVTVTLGKLAKKDTVAQGDLGAGCVGTQSIADGAVTGKKLADGAVKAGEHISVARDAGGDLAVSAKDVVFSVNGERGDVIVDQDFLGLADIAYSGNYRDLIGAPDTGVYSVNGQTGKVWIDKDSLGLADVAVSGSFLDLVDAPESGVLSVNGQTGNVILTADLMGLAKVATSGSYNDLKDKPEGGSGGVTSVNGQTGEVTISASTLGLGALATKDTVARGDLDAQCVGSGEIRFGSILSDHISGSAVGNKKLAKDAVTEEKIADGAVTGAKLGADAVKAGANISVTRDGSNNVVIATSLTTGVTSVNGKTGDVTLDKQTLGLGGLTDDRQFPLNFDPPTDFNEMQNGMFCVVGSSSHVCTHFPVSVDNVSGSSCVWFVFSASSSDNSYRAQLAVSGKTDRSVCVRVYSSGSWSAWKELGA